MIINRSYISNICKLGKLRTAEEVDLVCQSLNLKNYYINVDLSVDVDGDVNLSHLGLKIIPIQFNHISGHFLCHSNQLKSLKHSPRKVEGGFNCSNNQLRSLRYGPREAYFFDCSYNQLKNLKFSPKEVRGVFDCSHNQLISLIGAPYKAGAFDCSSNQLSSLEHLPLEIENFLICLLNKFESSADQLIHMIREKCIKIPKEIYLI